MKKIIFSESFDMVNLLILTYFIKERYTKFIMVLEIGSNSSKNKYLTLHEGGAFNARPKQKWQF